MTIKRGADGTKGPLPSRQRDGAAESGASRAAQRTQSASGARQTPEPLSTSLDGFDSDPPTETRLTGSGSTAVDEIFREGRGRPSLLSSMTRVLDDTRKKIESEIQVLRDEAASISADPARSLDEKMTALADVRARMDKPRRRLISIRRRTRTAAAVATRDHDGAAKRAKATFVRAQTAPSTIEQALALAGIAAELKLPLDASAAGGALRVDVDGVHQRAAFGRLLVSQAPSVDDAFALLALLGGPRSGAPLRAASFSSTEQDDPISTNDSVSANDSVGQLLSRLHDVRST